MKTSLALVLTIMVLLDNTQSIKVHFSNVTAKEKAAKPIEAGDPWPKDKEVTVPGWNSKDPYPGPGKESYKKAVLETIANDKW